MNKIVDKVMAKTSLPLIILAGILVIVFVVLSNKSTVEENNAYLRVINCMVSIHSVNSTKSIKEDINACYTSVENDLGIKLERHDK